MEVGLGVHVIVFYCWCSQEVLILVLMEVGLGGQTFYTKRIKPSGVLILVLMEVGLGDRRRMQDKVLRQFAS